jgi:Flp pilus assembly protein TadD
VIRKLAALAALGLLLSPALAAQQESSAAMRALNSGKDDLRRDEYGMAVDSFTRCAALMPTDKLAFDLRACAYLKMDSLNLASKDIAKSQQIDADEKTGYFANWLSGVALLLQADTVNAESALAKATRGSPSIAGPRIVRARQNTDSLLGGDGRNERTNEQYRRKLAELLLDESIDSQLFGGL